jgi:hypothetical protein
MKSATPSTHRITRALAAAFLATLAGIAIWQRPAPETATLNAPIAAAKKTPPPALPSTDAPVPPSPAQIERLVRAAEADGYEIHHNDTNITASNGRHGLSAQWSADGSLRLESLDHRNTWNFLMKSPGTPTAIDTHDGKIAFHRANMSEWFLNDARGIEHGFDVPTPPARHGENGFHVTMDITTSLRPEVIEDGRSAHFLNADGIPELHYRGLVVFDANNRSLPAHMQVTKGEDHDSWQLAIHVDDRDARYPLVIDPVFTTNHQTINPSPQLPGERFATSVSISGNRMAVGVPMHDGPGGADTGAVDLYIYQEQLRLWQKTHRLYPSDPLVGANFGQSLHLDADTLIVGAPNDGSPGLTSGAAYIFSRNAGGSENWGVVTKLLPADGHNGATFGASVALHGSIAAIGSPFRTGVGINAGAAYASFRDNSGTWSGPAQITGFNPIAQDRYGHAVAVSGNRIAVSALYGEHVATPDNAGIVTMHHFTLGENGLPISNSTVIIHDLNPSSIAQFGAALAMQGDRLVVGSPMKPQGALVAGAALIYQHQEIGGWTWNTEIRPPDGKNGDNFGASLGLSGDTLAIGAPTRDEGSFVETGGVYLFERSLVAPGGWGFTELLLRTFKQNDSRHGASVAISGDKIAAGIPLLDLAANIDMGILAVYLRNPAAWRAVVTPEPFASGAPASGAWVSIDRERIARGEPGTQPGGRVILSTINQTIEDSWATEAILNNPSAQIGASFGHSVAVHGNWLLVGAPLHDKGGLTNAGRAYLYRRTNASGWTLFKELDLPLLTANAEFGTAVALTDRWAFVGAPGMNHAFVFDRYEGGTDNWDISTILNESLRGGGFGRAIAVDGNHAAIAAPQLTGVAPPGEIPAIIQGAGVVRCYHMVHSGGDDIWQETKALPQLAPDGSFGTQNGEFGSALSMRGGILTVGEPGRASQTGRAHVFAINQGGPLNWGLAHTLDAPAAAPGDRFGAAIGIGTRWYFIGAPGRNRGGIPTGEVFVYDRANVGSIAQPPTSVIAAPFAREGDQFGAALATSDEALIVGMPGDGITGSYAVFHRQSTAWGPFGNPLGTTATDGDQLGRSVAIGTEYLVVGAPMDTVSGNASAGSVHLYQRNPAAASGWSYVKMLFADVITIGAQFGSSLDIRGDIIAVGAPGWDGKGAVHIFQRNQGGANNWGHIRQISPAALAAGDEFGSALALGDDLLAVGAPSRNAPAANDAGRVFVFGRNTGGNLQWGALGDFGKAVPVAFDYFGTSVDVSNDRILVGAPLSDERGSASGAAYIYSRPTGSNLWSLLATWSPVDNVANNRLGGSVAFDGIHGVAGAIGESTHAAESGAAWIFRDLGGDATNWLNVTKLTVGDTESPAIHANLRFGSAVAIKGDQVAIGARNYDEAALTNIGAVYLFGENHGLVRGWGLMKKLVAHGVTSGALMGSSVAMTRDFIIAGAPEADQGAQIDAGYFFVFGQSGTAYETWARSVFGDAAVNNPALKDTIWGPNADSDRDGLPNSLEAFMALDPKSPNANSAIMTIHRDATDGLVFRFRQGKNSHGTIGRVTWSRDLAEWRGGESNVHDDILITTRVHRDEPDHFIIEARISPSQLLDEPRMFMRLEVQTP